MFAYAELETFIVDLQEPPQEAKEWFSSKPASRSIGGSYGPEIKDALWIRADSCRLFDALVFVDETSAARLNPTARYLIDQPVITADGCLRSETIKVKHGFHE
jgi:hypothetical protein